jgi:putative PEP-CTERM system histidine kinase
MDLLECIGDQLAGSLLNIHLTKELMARKEMQAFQTMSTFFVHDLKNAASTLDLMLQNLPVHFDDPAFRQDALQGIGSAAHRINEIIGRLSALQHELRLKPTEIDLNQLVTKTLKLLNGILEAEVVTRLPPLPRIFADPEKLESVVTNLLLNARDAVSEKGRIAVETSRWNDRVVLSVADNGCGMTSEFIQSSLFRPFRTTKKKGLGIGMFQVKMIIDAHDGTIQVKSEPGAGTTFRVILPAKLEAQ